MARRKVKLAWIVTNNERKACLKKRRAGLMKKVAELSILCGIEACIVIFSPDEVEPVCWPSQVGAKQVLERFFGLTEIEQSKKMTTQETYCNERMAKLQEKFNKHERIDQEMEMNQIMNQISHGRSYKELNLREANGLASLMGTKLKEVMIRLQYSEQIPSPPPTSPLLPPQRVTADEVGHVGGRGLERRTSMESFDWDQWLMEIMNSDENIASTSGANDMRLPHGNTGTTNDGNGSTQQERNVRKSGDVGTDMIQSQPPRNIGSSSNVRNYMDHPNEADESSPYYHSP